MTVLFQDNQCSRAQFECDVAILDYRHAGKSRTCQKKYCHNRMRQSLKLLQRRKFPERQSGLF